jgi:hypothetical protein
MNVYRLSPRFLFLSVIVLWSAVLTAQVFRYDNPTPVHQQIPGSPLWLIPPTGFELSKQIKGFQHPDYPTASLLLIEVPAPVRLIFEGMTPEALVEQGMKLVQSDTLRFHERDSYWLTVDQTAMGMTIRKHIFAFGDDTQTFLLNATFSLDGEANWGDSLRQSLYTLVWREGLDVDPLAALPYEFPAMDSLGWQVASVMGNATVYSLDGRVPTQSPEGALFLVDKSVQDVVIYEGEAFCRRRLKNFPQPLVPDEDRGFTAVEIDGLRGTTCYAREEAADGSTRSYYRMTALFPEGGGYFLLLGMTKLDEAEIWQKVEHATHAFRLRR